MAEGPSPGSFGAVLDGLCLRPVGRRRHYSNHELARLVRESGGEITNGYIASLRRGERDNPSLRTIEHLAAALEVCPAMFVGGRKGRRGDERPRRTFSAKLRHLFDVVHPPERAPYTPDEVASSISAAGTYGPISAAHVHDFLHPPGNALPNPRLKHLLALAAHFRLTDDNGDGPQAAYFLDDDLAAVVDAELADFLALRAAGAEEFVTRTAEQAAHWSPQMRRQAIRVFTEALESGERSWVFPPKGA